MAAIVYLVVGDRTLILGAYFHQAHANVHSRCITGASVVTIEVYDTLPEAIIDQLQEDFEDDEDDTPVTDDPRKLK